MQDDWGFYFKKMIFDQNEKRNNIIWMYGLRNEIPKDSNYKKGLISFEFNYSQISDKFAGFIFDSLGFDSYMRRLSMRGNNISYACIKNLCDVLKINNTLINLDLSFNNLEIILAMLSIIKNVLQNKH